MVGERGVLGYLWASDADDAASYEPRKAAEDEGYEAGLRWLERLQQAKEHGLRPSEALSEFSALPVTEGLGRVQREAAKVAIDLATLRELASKS
ncbi:hypothetical protein CD790_20940 [Streptomyces sp. SAJ15]|nr:hypothetical protein CD790_20940 [Streptomyces sp. SAJ15]